MKVRLVVEQGGKRRVMQLRPPRAVLGRAHGNTVRIPSADVSRQHCRLRMEDGLVTIEDLDSVNGTFLNGRRIKRTEHVRPGDQIEVGPVLFTVEYELTPEALERLREQDEPMNLLEALADGEVLEAEDMPILGAAEVEEADLADAAPLAMSPDDEEAVDFDLESPWQMPDGSELRDILSQMEEDEPPTRKQRPRPRPKR